MLLKHHVPVTLAMIIFTMSAANELSGSLAVPPLRLDDFNGILCFRRERQYDMGEVLTTEEGTWLPPAKKIFSASFAARSKKPSFFFFLPSRLSLAWNMNMCMKLTSCWKTEARDVQVAVFSSMMSKNASNETSSPTLSISLPLMRPCSLWYQLFTCFPNL